MSLSAAVTYLITSHSTQQFQCLKQNVTITTATETRGSQFKRLFSELYGDRPCHLHNRQPSQQASKLKLACLYARAFPAQTRFDCQCARAYCKGLFNLNHSLNEVICIYKFAKATWHVSICIGLYHEVYNVSSLVNSVVLQWVTWSIILGTYNYFPLCRSRRKTKRISDRANPHTCIGAKPRDQY